MHRCSDHALAFKAVHSRGGFKIRKELERDLVGRGDIYGHVELLVEWY